MNDLVLCKTMNNMSKNKFVIYLKKKYWFRDDSRYLEAIESDTPILVIPLRDFGYMGYCRAIMDNKLILDRLRDVITASRLSLYRDKNNDLYQYLLNDKNIPVFRYSMIDTLAPCIYQVYQQCISFRDYDNEEFVIASKLNYLLSKYDNYIKRK